MQIHQSFRSKRFFFKLSYQLAQLTQVKSKFMNKYQCGTDLDFLHLLNNADKYVKFDDPNLNG